MRFVDIIRNKWRRWRSQRFLKKHGVESWKQYHREYDPAFNPRASVVNQIYYGYPYVYCFENHNHTVYDWDLAYDGVYVISQWIDELVKLYDEKQIPPYRFDCFRVIKNQQNEWEVNELGGGDNIFVAFKNERDFMMFLLRWS